MEEKNKVLIFLDDQQEPIAEFSTPITFELDTRNLTDGQHLIKIISKNSSGKDGIRNVPFVVRNGPSISIEGIRENDILDGVVPIMINAYGKGDQSSFIISGSETPQSIPSWIWIIIISFLAWAIFYLISFSFAPD